MTQKCITIWNESLRTTQAKITVLLFCSLNSKIDILLLHKIFKAFKPLDYYTYMIFGIFLLGVEQDNKTFIFGFKRLSIMINIHITESKILNCLFYEDCQTKPFKVFSHTKNILNVAFTTNINVLF